MKARPRKVRHRDWEHLRHSTHFLEWLDTQAERLEMEPKAVFDQLLVEQGLSYQDVEDTAAPEPDPG